MTIQQRIDEIHAELDDIALELRQRDQGWIRAGKKPKLYERVLVYNKRGKQYEINVGWWNGLQWCRQYGQPYKKITFWMHLPEPPRKQFQPNDDEDNEEEDEDEIVEP